jgi:hypothetical protein
MLLSLVTHAHCKSEATYTDIVTIGDLEQDTKLLFRET